jgi:hypothetical protein
MARTNAVCHQPLAANVQGSGVQGQGRDLGVMKGSMDAVVGLKVWGDRRGQAHGFGQDLGSR